LRLGAHGGVGDLYFLDEAGFAPPMPTGYTWSRVGERAVVPREDKRGRRVNVLGSLSVGRGADLVWEVTCGKVEAGMLLEFVCTRLAGLPGGAAALAAPGPCFVCRRSASTKSATCLRCGPGWWRTGRGGRAGRSRRAPQRVYHLAR
jgi:hypothetical protein